MMTETESEVLKIEDLETQFPTRDGAVKAVNGVSFSIKKGEVLGLVGESGSGKSVTGFSIVDLIDEPGRLVGGHIYFNGIDLTTAPKEHVRALRGAKIALIFQDPMMTLNPVLSIETQMIEAVLAHQKVTRKEARKRACDMLARVGIADPNRRIKAFPHEFSGGMRQRVCIAIALLHNPDLIIADEPTTALDVTVQGQILFEMQNLCRDFGTSLLWITHDLAVVAGIADRICVMYAGQIVEMGAVDQVIWSARHPYTRGLIQSVPSNNTRGKRLYQIDGITPSLLELPSGCAFRTRCSYSEKRCSQQIPTETFSDGSMVRCIKPLGGHS